jgi:hypothetical protein
VSVNRFVLGVLRTPLSGPTSAYSGLNGVHKTGAGSRWASEVNRSGSVQIAHDWVGLVRRWADSRVDVTLAAGRNPDGALKRTGCRGALHTAKAERLN